MLHELTHIGMRGGRGGPRYTLSLTSCFNPRASGVASVRGPHDAQFYKILDELTSEYEVNLTKGLIEADGFIGQGEKLGGRSAAPPANLRAAAALAAERRRQANVLLGQGPRPLGTLRHPTGRLASTGALTAPCPRQRPSLRQADTVRRGRTSRLG